MMENRNAIERNFFESINLMKVVACFAVILIHSSIFDNVNTNTQWWAVNLYNAISRFAVPMFIMISGALLINEKYSLKDFLLKRTLRIIPALIFWSVIYLAWLGDGRLFNIGVIKTILSGPVYYHLWYLYSIIGVMMFSPILSSMYNNSNKHLKLYFICIWFFVYSAYPLAKELLNLQFDIINVYELYPFFGLVGWYFLGAYVRDYIINNPVESGGIKYATVFIISAFAVALLTYLSSKTHGSSADHIDFTSPVFFERNSPLIIISTISLFTLLSTIKTRGCQFIHKSINEVASISLGIYCIHLLILRELLDKINYYIENLWVSVPLLSIIVFALSVAIIYPIRKIRIIRYIV